MLNDESGTDQSFVAAFNCPRWEIFLFMDSTPSFVAEKVELALLTGQSTESRNLCASVHLPLFTLKIKCFKPMNYNYFYTDGSRKSVLRISTFFDWIGILLCPFLTNYFTNSSNHKNHFFI